MYIMHSQWGTVAPNRTKIVPWGVLGKNLILQRNAALQSATLPNKILFLSISFLLLSFGFLGVSHEQH